MLGSKEDAEDVTQDVLLKALARLHQFRRESTFGTWLIQIAINEARMRKRKAEAWNYVFVDKRSR
jgi:RNA polymerase sigma-70 factor, ECF subfamily